MGTSLSGLTPATTFDGLLKTSDNDALDATLKTIGTGDGTDSVLQLSDSALQIGGTFNVDGGIATFKGVGSSYLTSSFIIKNSADAEIFRVRDDGQIYATYISAQSVNASSYALYGADYAPNIRVNIKGSGNDATTTALLVQNSDGTEHLKVTDDGKVDVRSSLIVNHSSVSSRALRLEWGSIFATDNASELNIGAVYSQATAPRIILGGKARAGGADAVLVQTLNGMYIAPTVNTEDPSAQLHVKAGATQDTIARFQDPLDASTYIDIKNDPVLTEYTGLFWGNRAKIRSKQTGTIFIDVNYGIAFADGNLTKSKMFANGSMVIGTSTQASNTMFQVKGSGATSATTALLVENSAGTDLLKVEDGGDVKIDNGVAADLKVKISPTDVKYIELDRQGRQVRFYSGATGNAGIFMVQDDKFSIGTNNTSLILLDENSNVRIGSGITAANTSAKLQVDSTTQGFLPPRMTDAERDAIATPAAGLMIYDTTNNQMNYWNGSTWIAF